MKSVEVIKAIVLESTAVTIAKKYVGFLLKIPRTFFKTWFLIQFRAISLGFAITLAVLKLIPWKKSSAPPPATNETVPKAPSETESNGLDASKTKEPKSEDIVNGAKKLRTYTISITKFTGEDLFWDLPLLRAKSSRLNRNLYEGDWQKIRAARKAIADHPVFHPMPKSKAEYDQLMKEATEDIYEYPPVPKSTEDAVSEEMTHCGQESDVKLQHANKNGYIPNCKPTKAKDKCPPPVPKSTEDTVSEEMTHCGQVSERGDVQLQNANMNGYIPDCIPIDGKDKSKKKVNFCLDDATCSNKDSTCRHDIKQLAIENKLLKSRLNMTNCKLEEMLTSSNKILGEVSRLNEHLSKLSTVSSKMSSLEHELGEGKQLLREVEEERNEMKLKLMALEKLIKEEEEYLDELSCESGYEEIEHFCDCTDEI